MEGDEVTTAIVSPCSLVFGSLCSTCYAVINGANVYRLYCITSVVFYKNSLICFSQCRILFV